MSTNGDVAEQIIRLSLEGAETTIKLTGAAAKNIAILLITILKEEQKTSGKARLTNMIKSGKALKVFSIKNEDLDKFVLHAKQYGVLYTVLKEKDNETKDNVVDIIARAEDAAKIDRIIERYDLVKIKSSDTEMTAENPMVATTDKSPLSELNSMQRADYSDKGSHRQKGNRASVKKKLDSYKRDDMGVAEGSINNKIISAEKKNSEVNR